jgi:7-cyano-7-deazaguanine reductase
MTQTSNATANSLLLEAPLGKSSATPTHYDPGLLFPIPRSMARDGLALGSDLPFMGQDLWTAYELGWLNLKGKPQVAIGLISVPCETPFMVESKSFKLYLNSLNDHRFDSAQQVALQIAADINPVLWGGQVPRSLASVELLSPAAFGRLRLGELEGLSLDRLDVDMDDAATPAKPQCLAGEVGTIEETLTSDLLRALCRVTGQPDWGSVQIHYVGPAIDQAALLRYLVGFRNQQEFHEPLAERIFVDIWRHCRPLKLQVLVRFTRRGGLDINPLRTSHPGTMQKIQRSARQ